MAVAVAVAVAVSGAVAVAAAVNFSNYGSRNYRRSIGEVGIIDGRS